MKKILSLLLSLLMITAVLPLSVVVSAETTLTDGDYTYVELDDGTVQISKYFGTDLEVTVPATLGGKAVSKIGNEAFDGNKTIEIVTIPEGVTAIGDRAFRNCECIEKVNISSTVTHIGGYAFERNLALQSIDIPATVKTMGDRVFYNSPILTEVTLHEGLEKMGYRFLSGTAVSRIYIPTTVTSANEAFAEAGYLDTVSFGEGITAIPNDMFEDNTSLRELTIPSTVTKLGNDSLCQMGALESVVIPDNVTELGEYVLYECKKLKSVTIGSGVTVISYRAFAGCTSLTTVTIPDNVTVIGGDAFYNCSRLASVKLSENLTDIGSYSFAKTALTEVTIPASVTKGSYPFEGCANLKTIRFAEGATTVVQGLFQNTAVETAVIPEGVTELTRDAFKNCKKLTDVSLPSTLKTVGSSAFEDCTTLETIDIPASVKRINYRAFANTTSLKNVTFHEGIQTLEGQLFYDSALTSIYIPKTLSTTNSPFENSNITDITFSEGITTLTATLFRNDYKLTEITIPETVTRIGQDCFVRTNLKSVIIPDSVKTIDSYAFYDCDNLYAVRIGAGIRKLPYQCFYGCDVLQNVIIPETVTDMDSAVFEKSGLSYQKLPDALLYIPNSTFRDCQNLEKVDCSDRLESIGDDAFKNCTSFTTLNTSVQSLSFNNSTFDNCPKFTDARFYVFNPAGTGIESTGSIGVDHTLVHFTVKYDIRDDWADEDIRINKLYINLPNNMEIVTNSFSGEGINFDNDAYSGDYKSFDISGSKTTGEMRFSAYLNSSDEAYKNMTAEVEFRYKGTYFRKSLGEVQFTTAKLSLFAPSTVTDNTIAVSGYTANVEREVKITISHLKDDGTVDSSVTHTVTPNKNTGKYTAEALRILVEGKTAANEDMFEVYAESGGVKSDVVSFTYMPGAVKLVKAIETVNIRKFYAPGVTNLSHLNQANEYDITGIFTRGTSPVVLINPAEMLQFKIRLENDENISDVYLMSHKGDDWRFMTLYYDAESDYWIGEGYFNIFDHELVSGQTYVPGALNLLYYYGERKDTYKEHYYGSSVSNNATGHDIYGAATGEKPQLGEPFYYDKDGKPHGELGDYHDTINDTVKNVFVHIVTGKWNKVPTDVTKGGLKAFWQWGNTDDNAFRLLHGGAAIGPDGLPILKEDRADMLNRDASKDGKQRNVIDPSGIVYEAVEGNPVEGATATIYKLNEDSGEWEVWNAADYEQNNPLLTNNEGAYAWLTDEGRFKVTISKEGYESVTSEEFDIPPEKLGLNFSLVDNVTHPTVTFEKDAGTASYTLKFSKFMQVDTVTADTVVIEGLNGASIKPVYLSEGDAYADTFTVTGARNGNEVKATVTDSALSYSGVSAEAMTATVTATDYVLLGDVDGDETITIIDATYIQRKLADIPVPFAFADDIANVDGDDDVTILDATFIQRYLASLPAPDGIGKPIE